MITRPNFARQWGVHRHGITVNPEVVPPRPPLIRNGTAGLNLPRPHHVFDITNPQTWHQPVRFTH